MTMSIQAPSPLSDPLLDIATQAAQRACHLLEHPPTHLVKEVHAKGLKDFATGIDLESERLLRELFAKSTPDIPLLGEEGGGAELTDPIFWLADTLDGTLNFSRGNRLHGLNLALIEGGQARLAITVLPQLGETYFAVKGQGAWKNGMRIQMPNVGWAEGTLTHGSPFSLRHGLSETYSAKLNLAGVGALNSANVGASSVSMAWIAQGVFNLGIFKNNNAWDVQCGALLIREAGGRLVDADGSEHTLWSQEVMAGAPRALDELMEAFAKEGLLRFS